MVEKKYPNPAAIGNSGDKELIERVKRHLGEEYLGMPVGVAAQFDTGDLDNSDPRIRASNNVTGDFTRRGNKL